MARRRRKLGSVHFATSCSAEAQPQFNRAVALLHSFEFAHAIEGFNATLQGRSVLRDGGVGHRDQPVGQPVRRRAFVPAAPLAAGARRGRLAAKAIGPKTPRERGYIDAVAQLYANFETVDQRTRVARLPRRDGEASRRPTRTTPRRRSSTRWRSPRRAPPTDKTYADQLKAGAILEKLFASQPDHPGLAHYIIHSYDVPPLADRALAAARRYAKIAPSAPHALHMPSHTFTRVGVWQESIDTNIASGAVAKREGRPPKSCTRWTTRPTPTCRPGRTRAARSIVDALPEVKARFDPDAIGSAAPGSAGVFALAAIPGALRARARRLGRRRGARAAAEPIIRTPTR